MPDHTPRSSPALLLIAGIGVGAVTGVIVGLLATRQARNAPRGEISETVDDLKRRAEQILTELSQSRSASDTEKR